MISISQVDCTVNSETCGRYGVNGYPTLKIFRNGEDSAAYDGPRSAGGLLQIVILRMCVSKYKYAMSNSIVNVSS